jgi:REP-associated tyrosine transposase
MARLARVKALGGGVYYHLCARVAGPTDSYPLDNSMCRRRIVETIQLFSRVYCCSVLGFAVMGNHYHLLIWMESRRPISRKELRKRAGILYGDTLLDGWQKANWERFEERVFDVSEMMRSVQSSIARWFNHAFGRRGRFWADRFKSTMLEDHKDAMDCLLYIELNAVRAGIVKRPEEYEGGSLYYREIKKDGWMMPLSEMTGIERRANAISDLKARVYYRGAVPTKENQRPIPKRIIKEEEALGFTSQGVFRKRIRHFVDGVAIGNQEFIRRQIEQLREQGQYKRRRNPIEQMGGMYLSLREQRTTAL